MIVQSTHIHWSPMELHVLKNSFPHEDISSVMVKLPGRTRAAINARASMLGLKKLNPEPPAKMNNFSTTKTIERLEAELNLAKAQAECDAARQRYSIFSEQCKIAFTRALSSNPSLTLPDLFKQNSKDFSRLNGAISNSARRLLEAQIELELVD